MDKFFGDLLGQPVSSKPKATCTLTRELQSLERDYAEKGRLSQLSAQETRQLLSRLRMLQSKASMQPESTHRALHTAIARFSADVSNHLMDTLVDTLQQKQHSIDFLQQELSRKLREQHAANQLLQQTQQLRLQTQTYSEDWQIGSVL